jgi:ABC-2 type transport system permease protein
LKPLNFNRIAQSFQTKNFKYGGYATILSLIVLVILVVINLVADQLPVKFDLSENKMYSLSAQTTKIVKKLKQPVTIYTLAPTGQSNQSLAEILKKYRDCSTKIVLKTVDPNKNPGFIKQFGAAGVTPEQGSLIVVAGRKHKVIQASDMVNYSFNEQTGQQQAVSLAVEQRVTAALLLTAGNQGTPVVYQTQGHGEIELASNVTNQLQLANYELKNVSLITQPLPGDAAAIFINAPQQDLTADETAKLRRFLAKGGRLLCLIDYTEQALPNLNALLSSYGIAVQPQIVIEGDSSQHLTNNPLFLLPAMEDHQILKSLQTSQTPILFPGSQSIKTLDLKKKTTTIEPLLTTSAKAWAKVNVNSLNEHKAATDPAGPFNVAVAVTDQPTSGAPGAKLIVAGNAQFLNPQFTVRIPGNLSFLTNSLSWLLGRKDALSIQPKSLLSYSLRLNETQALLYITLVVAVIPLGILITGLIVWLRRRHL